MSPKTQLPVPHHFDPVKVGEVWRVPYQECAEEAVAWAKLHNLQPIAKDKTRVCLLAIDVQNTFCIPDFELFVGGRSGIGAVEDNVRLCQFIYRNLGTLTEIALTMDSHTATQIFHSVFWIDDEGRHPSAMTMISLKDVEFGLWKANPAIAPQITSGDVTKLQTYALHYVRRLDREGKYPLTIWPYHSMLGGIGHALVSALEEACFFHNLARQSQTHFELKGNNPLTENYSVLQPEVMVDQDEEAIAQKNAPFIQKLLEFDAVVIAGQAKSHCVAWTIDNLLSEIQTEAPKLVQKIFLLEDCTSPVVVPGVIDFTDQADAAFKRFAESGMHLVKSTDPIESWMEIS